MTKAKDQVCRACLVSHYGLIRSTTLPFMNDQALVHDSRQLACTSATTGNQTTLLLETYICVLLRYASQHTSSIQSGTLCFGGHCHCLLACSTRHYSVAFDVWGQFGVC